MLTMRELARVVREVDNAIYNNAIQWIACFFFNTYPLDSDLSGG